MTTKEFTEMCRDLQSAYRKRMGEPMGYGPRPTSLNKQKSMLVDGNKTGKNFVNEFAFNYAKCRVANILPSKRSILMCWVKTQAEGRM